MRAFNLKSIDMKIKSIFFISSSISFFIHFFSSLSFRHIRSFAHWSSSLYLQSTFVIFVHVCFFTSNIRLCFVLFVLLNVQKGKYLSFLRKINCTCVWLYLLILKLVYASIDVSLKNIFWHTELSIPSKFEWILPFHYSFCFSCI